MLVCACVRGFTGDAVCPPVGGELGCHTPQCAPLSRSLSLSLSLSHALLRSCASGSRSDIIANRVFYLTSRTLLPLPRVSSCHLDPATPQIGVYDIAVMAFTDFLFSFSTSKSQEDQIGSTSSTPPGIQTPQPDPTDRRFPGILSSYFGQVGLSSSYSQQKLHPPTSSPNSEANSQAPNLGPCSSQQPFSTLPLPRSMATGAEEKDSIKMSADQNYPTPPKSSQSSFDKDLARVPDESPANMIAGFRAKTQPLIFIAPACDDPRPKSRKMTCASEASSTVATDLSVLAKEFSFQKSPSGDEEPDVSLDPISSLDSSSSAKNALEKLTAIAEQNTPPRTPRSLSHESKQSRTTSPHPRAPTSKPSLQTSPGKASTSDAVVGEPKGKLSVSIFEGRGLRPSCQPYVVCQFQWNEYISKGPRSDSVSVEDSRDVSQNAVPQLGRADSDNRKPMAIPMKSRQSSQTSMTSRESTKGNQVTDPVWNRDAIL